MNPLTVEVEIDHGKLTAKEPHLLPDKGRGLLTVLTTADTETRFSIETGEDGLPVIRTRGEVITSARVREAEGLRP
jgi:hypothetical protein